MGEKPLGKFVRRGPPRVDGWTLTHVCAGQERTLIWSGIVALCPVCRWSCDLSPLHPNANRRESDD